MKVLLLGATGNLGLRLVPALLSHKLEVIAYVRSASKLRSLLPEALTSQITTVEGDAKSVATIKKAILDNGCDAVVNTAGLAAMAPWGKSEINQIVEAVAQATIEAGQQRGGKPLRAWFLGGLGVLTVPGTKKPISSFAPVYLEHQRNLDLLRSFPADSIRWTLLCPSLMTPTSTELVVPTKASSSPANLLVSADSPPGWHDSFLTKIPLVGNFSNVGANMGSYTTTLEDNAELIARDLEKGGDEWVGKPIGVKTVPAQAK